MAKLPKFKYTMVRPGKRRSVDVKTFKSGYVPYHVSERAKEKVYLAFGYNRDGIGFTDAKLPDVYGSGIMIEDLLRRLGFDPQPDDIFQVSIAKYEDVKSIGKKKKKKEKQ